MKGKNLTRILILAGGTGGHVFPGLSVAQYFRDQNIDVHWLGTQKGLEATLVPAANVSLHFINIEGVRRNGLVAKLMAPIKISRAIWQAKRIINEVKPDLVIGMGGFVSGPGGIATWLSGKPLIIHEQNAIAGMTNKILAKFARKVLQAFPNAFHANAKVMTIGNPVRQEIEAIKRPQERLGEHQGKFRLLVLGGSLGAQALNDTVPQAIAQLPQELRPEIIHQTGNKLFEVAKDNYANANIPAQVLPFIADMNKAYEWADMVLCRAGALTVAELCAVGLGAIFIPYPYAVDDHQTANANFMVKNQAAICIAQSQLTAPYLAEILREFSLAPQKRLAMANAAYALRKEKVTKNIFEICKEVL